MSGLRPERGVSKYLPSRDYHKELKDLLYARIYGAKVVPSLRLTVCFITFITDKRRSRL
jgi:hypothetical protein